MRGSAVAQVERSRDSAIARPNHDLLRPSDPTSVARNDGGHLALSVAADVTLGLIIERDSSRRSQLGRERAVDQCPGRIAAYRRDLGVAKIDGRVRRRVRVGRASTRPRPGSLIRAWATRGADATVAARVPTIRPDRATNNRLIVPPFLPATSPLVDSASPSRADLPATYRVPAGSSNQRVMLCDAWDLGVDSLLSRAPATCRNHQPPAGETATTQHGSGLDGSAVKVAIVPAHSRTAD